MNYLKNLPEKINNFQLRHLSVNDFHLIDYSTNSYNLRYISSNDIDAEKIASEILYEVISDSEKRAGELMLQKLNLIEQFKIDFPTTFFMEYNPIFLVENGFNNLISKAFTAFDIWDLEKNTKSIAIISIDLKREIDVIINWITEFSNVDTSKNIRMAGEDFDSKDQIFSNVVYLYTTKPNVEKEELRKIFRQNKLVLKMRDDDYRENLKPDFFISHDSKDKDDVARPLYEALTKKGFKVWYDEYSLKIGDSLTESIEKGIKEAGKGILILSKNFLSNEKWAKNELQSLKTKQIVSNTKIILPIWHEINEEDLYDNYWLLDKIGGNTKDGIENLATKIFNDLKK